MNKIIEFIKRLFRRNQPLLIEENNQKQKENIKQKENFFKDIKIDNNVNETLVLQRKLENGIIDETNLNEKQINELKELYCTQITNLNDSIHKYKLKLNMN